MVKDNNIEDLYNSSFNNFSFEPNKTIWDNIENNLDSNFTEFEYKSKFDNYTFTPSSSAWNKIAAKLWFNNFLNFSSNSFNIYYAASIAFAILGSILFFYNPNQYNPYINSNNIVINNNSSEKLSDNSIKLDKPNNNSSFIGSNNEINFDENNNKQFSDNNYYPEKIDTAKSIYKKNKINEKSNSNIAKNNLIEPKKITVTKYITDTVIVRDTVKVIIKDTVFSEKPKDILVENTGFSPWSVDLYYSPMLYNINTQAPDYIQNSIDTSFTSIYNWSIGLNANYKINNFNIQAGLAYTKYSEKFSYKEETISTNLYNDTRFMPVGEYTYVNKYPDWVISGSHNEVKIDTTSYTYLLVEYQASNTVIIDTVWIYNIDTSNVVILDSTQVTKYDTITAIKYDSVKVVIADTVRNISFYDVINQYSYIEIPIMIGYEFNAKHKLSYVLNAGLVTGIFVNAKGKGITLNNEIVNLNSLPFMKLNLTGMATAGIHYNFTKELSLILEATYRKNFTSIYQTPYFMKKRFNSYGLRVGVKYKF